MAGDKPWPQIDPHARSQANTAVLIVGAGLSGLCTAIDLIKRNYTRDFIIVEKSSGVGGVWHDNLYPGCCCDVWAALYSFSFEQNPNWTREYPGQEELLEHIVDFTQKHKLFQHIRFATSVEEARWDDEALKWRTQVVVAPGIKDAESVAKYEITSDFLVSAVGQLNQPRWPDISGLELYKGDKMHSARWNWSVGLKGKRVALLGNGCSSVQILPEIADIAKHTTVFQRTPNYISPRLDRPIHAPERLAYKYAPPLLWLKRALMMNYRESLYKFVIDGTSMQAKATRSLCLKSIQQAFPDDHVMQEKLTPTYQPGAKRIIVSDDYYPALTKSNVDLETRPIERMTEHSLVLRDGGEFVQLEDFDVVICATGFKSVDFLHPIRIYGRYGKALQDTWQNGARALYGITTEDMPNFAMLYGPNTNLGHSSIGLMIEAQSRYINGLIKPVLQAKNIGGRLAFWPKRARVDNYNEELQAVLRKSTWADRSSRNWYTNEAGLITNNWSGTVIEYQELLSKVDFEDFESTGDTEIITSKPVVNIGRVVEETQFVKTLGWLSVLGTSVVAAGWALRHSQYVRQLVS